MNTLHLHVVHRQSARLVRQKVLHATQFLGNGAGADNRVWYFLVLDDLGGADGLAHVQIHPQAQRDDCGEEDDEADKVHQPDALEALEGDHGEGEEDQDDAQDLAHRIQLLIRDPVLRLGRAKTNVK